MKREFRPIVYHPIGVIHSPFKTTAGTPIQPAGAEGVAGEVALFPEYREGVKDLSGFSHLILIYHFHLSKPLSSLLVRPYMDAAAHGVFATRAPSRPNSIGISIVRLVGIDGNILHIRDVDIVDGTPLLDMKPYVPAFDIRKVERFGWLERNVHKLPRARDDGRFKE